MAAATIAPKECLGETQMAIDHLAVLPAAELPHQTKWGLEVADRDKRLYTPALQRAEEPVIT